MGHGPPGFLSRPNAYHATSDATLFSSSLPVLPHAWKSVCTTKLNCTEYGCQFVDDLSSTMNKLHADVEDHAIRSLLPDDEDELLDGIMDGFELPNLMDGLDEYNLFSGGGLELESDLLDHNLSLGLSKVSLSDGVFGNRLAYYSFTDGEGHVDGKLPYRENPSRTLFVRNINSNVEVLRM